MSVEIVIQKRGVQTDFTKIALIVLWVGALLLLTVTIYQWRSNSNLFTKKKIMVDDILLTTGELKLGENTALINLGLNDMLPHNDSMGEHTAVPTRKVIYDKILLKKIEKSRPNNEPSSGTGFTVKPIPQ